MDQWKLQGDSWLADLGKSRATRELIASESKITEELAGLERSEQYSRALDGIGKILESTDSRLARME